jgi:hypothetical protein
MMNTKELLVEQLVKDQITELTAVRVFQAVLEFVKTQVELKKTQVNGWWEKRAKTYFAAKGWQIRFSQIAGQHHIHVWDGDSGYTNQDSIRLFLGFDSDMGNLTTEIFDDRNSCYGQAAQDRINRRKTLLGDLNWLNLAALRIDNYLTAKRELEGVMGESSYHNEAYYIIKNLAKLKD